MSERFTWKTEKLQHSDDEVIMVVDNANKEWKGHILNIVGLLNEQQATIQFLQNEIDELKKDIGIYKYEEKKHSETARKLYEENEQLKKARDESDTFIREKGLGAEFLNWCVAND